MLSFKFKSLHTFLMEVKTYDAQLDNVQSLLSDLCDAMHEQNAATFAASGFGDDNWPVDVRTDLCVFMEQVPRALHQLEAREAFSIDFYEQGVERWLTFEPQGHTHVVRCSCPLAWQPSPAREVVDSKHLETMLRQALEDFEACVAKSSPRLAQHPWFREWLSGTVAL